MSRPYHQKKLFELHYAGIVIALFSLIATAQGSPPSPSPLANTEAPNGEYALAWGIAGASEAQWSELWRLEAGDMSSQSNATRLFELFEQLAGDDSKNIEDYVVSTKSGRILATLQGLHYYELGDQKPNREEFDVEWSRNSNRLLVIEEGRYNWREIVLVEFAGGLALRNQSVGEAIRQMAQNALVQAFGTDRKFQRDRRHLSYSAEQSKFLPGGRAQIDVNAYVPKGSDRNSFGYLGRITFKILHRANNQFRLEFESMSKVNSN